MATPSLLLRGGLQADEPSALHKLGGHLVLLSALSGLTQAYIPQGGFDRGEHHVQSDVNQVEIGRAHV